MSKSIYVIGIVFLLAVSGCATIDDLHPTGGGRTYDVPYADAFRVTADALEEMKFSIKKDDFNKGEIRAQTDQYWNGMWHCKGNILGIFLSRVGTSQTRVEIQSLYVQARADLACKDKAQQAVSEITKRLRQSSSTPSLQNQPVPMVNLPLHSQSEVSPQMLSETSANPIVDPHKGPAKRNLETSLFDFRKTKWGMTKEQIKDAETASLENQGDQILTYSGQVAGKDVRIGYIFVGDKLVRGKYIFSEQHTNSNLFINDYMEIKNILAEKYGAPVEDKSVWSNELYRNAPQSWGTAVGAGHLRMISKWDTPSTSIIHVLMGDNFKISVVTQYTSRELRKLEEQSEKEKTLSNF